METNETGKSKLTVDHIIKAANEPIALDNELLGHIELRKLTLSDAKFITKLEISLSDREFTQAVIQHQLIQPVTDVDTLLTWTDEQLLQVAFDWWKITGLSPLTEVGAMEELRRAITQGITQMLKPSGLGLENALIKDLQENLRKIGQDMTRDWASISGANALVAGLASKPAELRMAEAMMAEVQKHSALIQQFTKDWARISGAETMMAGLANKVAFPLFVDSLYEGMQEQFRFAQEAIKDSARITGTEAMMAGLESALAASQIADAMAKDMQDSLRSAEEVIEKWARTQDIQAIAAGIQHEHLLPKLGENMAADIKPIFVPDPSIKLASGMVKHIEEIIDDINKELVDEETVKLSVVLNNGKEIIITYIGYYNPTIVHLEGIDLITKNKVTVLLSMNNIQLVCEVIKKADRLTHRPIGFQTQAKADEGETPT